MTADDRPEIVCLSIKRRYAEAIYRGEKRYEYRRQAPAVDPPYHLLLYETKPSQRITGAAIVDEVVTGDPDEVVNATVDETTHGPLELLEYFDGADEGSALHIADSMRFEPCLELFHVGISTAPQNFQYVESDDLSDTLLGDLVDLEAPIITEDTTA